MSLRLTQDKSTSPIEKELGGLQQLVDHVLVGVYRSTVDGKLVMANPALARIFGYHSPESMMESVADIGTQLYVEPKQREAWRQLFQSQDQTQEMIGPTVWQGFRLSRDRVWLEEYAQAICDPHGSVLGYEGVVLDVTTRYTREALSENFGQKDRFAPKPAEKTHDRESAVPHEPLRQELAAAQQKIAEYRGQLEQFQIAMQCSQEGLWVGYRLPHKPWDLPETPVWYSSQFVTLLGFDEQDFPPVLESWASCLHPEDHERVFQAMRDHIEHHVPYDVESRLKMKSGEYRWFKGKGQAIFDDQGTCIGGGGTIRDITDQIEAAEALKRKHALLTSVVEGTSDIIFVKDLHGRYLLINSTGAALLKRPIDEILGKTDSELSMNEAHPLFCELDDEVVRKRAPKSFEVDVENTGAVSRTLLVTKEIIAQTEEGFEGLLCIARDITYRKAAELTIQEREKRYRAIMDNAIDLIAEVDGDATFLYVSPNFQEVLGYAPQTLLGSNIFTLVHPEDRSEVIQEFTQGMRISGSGRAIYRYRHHNGEYRWFESTGRMFQTALGELRGVVVSRDITQRKETEKALEELNFALTHATPGISTLNSEGRFLQVNEAYAEPFGYTPEGLLGQSWKITVHPDDHAIALAALEVMRATGTGEFESRAVRKDGSIFYMQVVMVSGMNKADGNDHFHCFMRDVTERKQMEMVLRESDQKLQQVQKMEAIGNLAGGIAHDFNNILGAILGYSELALAQAPKEPRLISYLEEVVAAGQRAKELVKQILAFSRRSDQEREAVDLNVLVKDALKMVRATLPATIEIQSTFSDDSAVVFADPTQIHQVLMNLCANAEHAMRENGGMLTLSLTAIDITENTTSTVPQLKPGSYLQLTIQDSGHGMPFQVLDRIFEPFFTTKGLGEGTGLGLAVVHGIIVGHGGNISVVSEVGHGTKFTILFPRLDVVLPLKPEKVLEWPKGTGTVLFVDDEEVLAHWGEQVLSHLGYSVIPKTNPHEAVELFQRQPDQFDVVVTDQTMPTMNGEAFARALLNIRQDIPIVLCTGFSYTMSAEKARELGLKGFLMKPVNGAVLANTLKEITEERAGS